MQIVEVGTHQQLIDKEGKYCSLWRHQQQTKQEEIKTNESELEKNTEI